MPPLNKPNSSSSGESLPRKIKAKFLECFGYTTAHGYGRVADAADSRPRRWFWLIACVAAFGVFALQLYDVTLQFMSKPLKTRTWIAHQQRLPFPQVTVCNLNKIRLSKMPKEILQEFSQILDRYGIHNSTDESLTNNEDYLSRHILRERMQKRLAEYPDSYLQTTGHQWGDLILKCKYNDMECLKETPELWTQFWHPKYGNCYSFNRGKDADNKQTTVLTSSIPGHDAGLKLELNIEQYEYVSDLTDEAGVRVFIGSQNLMPFPYELGISASSGFSTGIMLRKVVIGRLDPFGNHTCEAKATLIDDNIFRSYNASYSDLACKISCLAAIMHQMCGCVYFKLKYENTKDVCDGSDQSTADCINEAYDKYSDGACDKDCRQKCREESFKMTVSTADWPAQHYKKTLQEDVTKEGLGNYSSELSINFLKLKIYYGELNFEVIDEELAYPSARFLSDIGGIMGMWIGISALTCVEVLELLAALSYMVFRRLKGERNNVHVMQVQQRDSPA